MIREKVSKKADFWRMRCAGLFSKTDALLVAKQIRETSATGEKSTECRVQSKYKKRSNHAWTVRKMTGGRGFVEKLPAYCAGRQMRETSVKQGVRRQMRGLSADRFDTSVLLLYLLYNTLRS